MAKSTGIDKNILISLSKQVALKAIPPEDISSIIYSYDESKDLSIEDQNKLLKFVHETNAKWQKPKSMNDMITEILRKVGHGSERAQPRYGSAGPASKDEISSIYNWVMDPNRK